MESSTLLPSLSLPTAPVSVEPASLFALLQDIPDPRKPRGRRYSLAAILSIIILAKLAGETSVSGIAHWARLRTAILAPLLLLRRPRLPCANTLTTVCAKVDVDDLNRRLADFFVPPLPSLPVPEQPPSPAPPRAQRHLALDGKSLRGSRRTGHVVQPAVHLLSLYDVTNQGTLAQAEVGSKDHEIPGALKMIAGKDLRGCVLSADALHTQRNWCRRVREQGGDYVVLAKKNQRGLMGELELLFEGGWPAWLEKQSVEKSEKGHGRREIRKLHTSREMNEYLGGQWKDVAQVFEIEREIVRNGKKSTEVVYGLTSVPEEVAGAEQVLRLVRRHWHIENRVHWRRDVTLGEDGCQVKEGRAAQVLASLNNTVLMLMDKLGVKNMAEQMREFAAEPRRALELILGVL
jgi:predicted transposase YbfD/YdcC